MELAVTAGPEEEEESETRAAICIRHQTGNQELYFCFDCTRVFCTYCQLADGSRTNHKPHRTSKLKDLLRIRKERIAQLRTQLKQFSAKHEATTNAANQLEAEKNVQLQTVYDAIDEFANRIHQEVDDLKATARRHLLKRAQQMWENSPVASLHTVAEETLSHVRQVRDSLELEIRRAEADELAMAVGRIEMDALGDQLAAFLDAQVELPERSAFDLTSLRSQLHASVSQLEAEVSRSKETFIRSLHKRELFPNPERVRLVEQQTFHQQELVLPADQNQSPNINSVTHEEDTDIIYFTDEFNPSKIKALNLKTRQLSEVRL